MTVAAPMPSARVTIGDRGEAGRARQRADAVADVATKVFEPDEGSRLALELLGLFDASERASRGGPRLFRPHPAPLEVVLEEPEMGVDLQAELTLGSVSPEDADQTEPRAS